MPLKSADIEEAFSCREAGIKKLLSSILNLNIQYEPNEKSIVSIVNRLLSTARHRKEGLQYLNLIINSFSASIIAENALNWVNHCIIRFPGDVLRELKLRVLGIIIGRSHDESDFNKRFTSDYISKVFDNCITTTHVNPPECKTALATLTVCMKHYPSWFGVHSPKIEKFISIFLDSDHKDLVETAALAFLYLQQVGGAGSNGMNHKQNFTKNFHKLCRTVHTLYNKFFENEKELFHTESSEDETFEFQDSLTDNSLAILHVNSRRICNIFKFLEVMLNFFLVKENYDNIIPKVRKYKLCRTVHTLDHKFFEIEKELFHTVISDETFEFQDSLTDNKFPGDFACKFKKGLPYF